MWSHYSRLKTSEEVTAMKELYEEPVIEIVHFQPEDIITNDSVPGGDDIETEGDEW